MKLFKIVMLGLFAFLLSACELINPDKNPTFGGIDWGDKPEVVEKKLKETGFPVSGRTKNGNTGFEGTLMDSPTEGLIIYTDGGASKMVVYVNPNYMAGEFFSTYDKITGVLIAKYGNPAITVHEAEGDSDFLKLLQIELSKRKGDEASVWVDLWDFDERGGGLTTAVEGESIVIRYESVAFSKSIVDMKEKKSNAL